MAENYEVGKTYYLPVRVYDVMDSTYTYPVRFEFENGSGCMDGKNALKSDPGLLFTAYEVYLCNVTALKSEIATLKSENERLSKQNEELGAERDKFAKTAKDKADLANKARDEGYDAHVDLVTARAAIDHLQEENKKLKQELKDAEATYNVVADTSIKRKNRITTMEEVIVALVEKIRRLEGDD